MPKLKWFKGNIHTHSNIAGGDADPEGVVSWYRRHGYDFLVLSEHNHRHVFEYGEGKRRFKRPLMIPGEEVGATVVEEDGRRVPIHLGAVGISCEVEPILVDGVLPTFQANIDSILDAGGIVAINHPNFRWAFDHHVINQVTGASLLEVYNGNPSVNNLGGPGKLSCEEIWDGVLSSGRAIFGVATDDAHHYRDFTFARANPGRGWVVARAPELSREAIIEALATGDFYASTRVTLSELELSAESIALKIEQEGDFLYTTRFTGRNGAVLAETSELEATYRPKGDEGYVRATVSSSAGNHAWTQPVFLGE